MAKYRHHIGPIDRNLVFPDNLLETIKEHTQGVAWDEDFWIDGVMSGSAHYVSNEGTDEPPVILVPDGRGDYREHQVIARPRGRMGF